MAAANTIAEKLGIQSHEVVRLIGADDGTAGAHLSASGGRRALDVAARCGTHPADIGMTIAARSEQNGPVSRGAVPRSE